MEFLGFSMIFDAYTIRNFSRQVDRRKVIKGYKQVWIFLEFLMPIQIATFLDNSLLFLDKSQLLYDAIR